MLSDASLTNFLGSLNHLIVTENNQTGALQAQVDNDIIDFNNNPHSSGNLEQLVLDSAQLLQSATQTMANINLFITLSDFGEMAGIPPSQSSVDTWNNALPGLQADVANAKATMFAGIFVYFTGTGSVSPFSTGTSLSPTSTQNIGVTINPAPATASASGPNITESVHVTNSTNAEVNVEIDYSANDNSQPSFIKQKIAPYTDQTVPLTVMPCSPGAVGTWTVEVSGMGPYTPNHTTFTQ